MARGRPKKDKTKLEQQLVPFGQEAKKHTLDHEFESTPVVPGVWTPPQMRGRKVSIEEKVHRAPMVSVREHMIRIQSQCDPIGFLIAVANGQLFEYKTVTDEGEVKVSYESPSMRQRIAAARYLSDKLMPRMGVVKLIGPDGDDPTQPPQAGQPLTFAQAVEKAATNLVASRGLSGPTIDAEGSEDE